MTPHWLDKLREPKTLKALLAVKLVAILAIWIALDDRWHVGDENVMAAAEHGGEKPVTQADRASGASMKDKADAGSGSDKKVASGEPAKKLDEATLISRVRKSFLANLLELPALNPDSIQKDELGKYMEIADRKKRQIEERLSLLKNREEQLKGLEGSIDDKLRRLDDERKFFAQTIQQEKDLKGERLDRLIATYSKMEPKKAAPVFEKLDKDLVVELFKAMPQKQVTLILETMSPDKSVQISEYYGRVRSAREYDLLKEMNTSLRKEFDDCKGMPSERPEKAKLERNSDSTANGATQDAGGSAQPTTAAPAKDAGGAAATPANAPTAN